MNKKVHFTKKHGDRYLVIAKYQDAVQIVGTLVVERMGWKQADAKRGTPSQTWRFISAVEGVHNLSDDYFKDIKARVTQIFS